MNLHAEVDQCWGLALEIRKSCLVLTQDTSCLLKGGPVRSKWCF